MGSLNFNSFILSLILSIFSTLNITFADTIKLAADTWYPFNGDPNSSKPGYLIEVAKAIFERRGHTVEYRVTPWTQAIEDARKGYIDGIIGPEKTDAPDFIFPSEPLGKIRDAFFVKAESSWTFTGIPSLSNQRLGYIIDYSYNDEVDKYIRENSGNPRLVQGISENRGVNRNIVKMLLGRLDVVIEVPEVFWGTVEQMSLKQDKFKEVGREEQHTEVFIAFSPSSKRSAQYARTLSYGINLMRKNGKLKEILDRYGISDWK